MRALHDGVGRGGKHLYPAFPYASYALMTRSDALAIKATLFSLKPIKYSPPSNNMSFPFDQRYLMVFWNALFKPAHRFSRIRISRLNGIAAPISSRRSAIAAIVTLLAIYCLDLTTIENSRARLLKDGRHTTSRPTSPGASAVCPTSNYRDICREATPMAGVQPVDRWPRLSTTV